MATIILACNNSHDSTGTDWHWVHLGQPGHRCVWVNRASSTGSDSQAKNKEFMPICRRKITRWTTGSQKEKWGSPVGCSSPWVPLVEDLWGSAVSQEGLNPQWETKPCLLWDYSQDKALSGCAYIVSTVRGKKNNLKAKGEKKNPPRRQALKKKQKDWEKREDDFLLNCRKHFNWQDLFST